MSAHIYSYRGDLIENRHTASVAIVDPAGKLLAYAGNPELTAHMRSSSKPFQAQALFQSGAATHFALSPKEIAITCGSHSGAARHTEAVSSYLKKINLGTECLMCGAHMPFDPEASKALRQARQEPTVLHSNCSGKHTGMLAAALALEADPTGYEQPEHPVQQLNIRTLRALSGAERVPYGIDGCGVPAFALQLNHAARMFATLAAPDAASTQYQQGLATTWQAMRAHPDMVAGPERMDTVFMSQVPNLAMKSGADGYYGLALRDTQWGPIGITVKVESGNGDARDPLVIKVLEALGALPPEVPAEWRRPIIRNVSKREVGRFEVELALTWL